MVELSKKEYRELAYEYLHEASKAALRIKSLKRNIQRIKNDITSLRAVNYGKERVDGVNHLVLKMILTGYLIWK